MGAPDAWRRRLAEINVIPLVDVMLVLLIIFMVTAPMLQRGVEVKLPQLRRAQEISSERLFVDVPLSFKRRPARLSGEGTDQPDGARRAPATGTAHNARDKQVFFRIDRGLLVQKQFDVFEQLKAAGVDQHRPGDGAAATAMNEATTDVIVARSHDVDRLSTMVMWSVVAHVVVTALILFMPHEKTDLTPKDSDDDHDRRRSRATHRDDADGRARSASARAGAAVKKRRDRPGARQAGDDAT